MSLRQQYRHGGKIRYLTCVTTFGPHNTGLVSCNTALCVTRKAKGTVIIGLTLSVQNGLRVLPECPSSPVAPGRFGSTPAQPRLPSAVFAPPCPPPVLTALPTKGTTTTGRAKEENERTTAKRQGDETDGMGGGKSAQKKSKDNKKEIQKTNRRKGESRIGTQTGLLKSQEMYP